MDNGYIKLDRSLLSKNLFHNEKLLKAWIWCLLKATHTEHKERVGRQEVILQPGQFVTGRFAAGRELSLPPSTVWSYLKLLQSNQSIDIKPNSKFSVVTVVNWALYQAGKYSSDTKSDSKWTANGQQMDTNNKGNKGKKELYSSSALFADNDLPLELAKELAGYIKANKPDAKVGDLQKWAVTFDRIMRLDKRQPEVIRRVMAWCQSDSFWQTNILSAEKLRQQFDMLELQMRKQQPVEAKKRQIRM